MAAPAPQPNRVLTVPPLRTDVSSEGASWFIPTGDAGVPRAERGLPKQVSPAALGSCPLPWRICLWWGPRPCGGLCCPARLPRVLPGSLLPALPVSLTCTSFPTELSAEAKAALLEFEERERQHKQGRYGSRRGGRRGGALVCRSVGDQRREGSERGRGKDHRPALLPTQPPVVVRSQSRGEPRAGAHGRGSSGPGALCLGVRVSGGSDGCGLLPGQQLHLCLPRPSAGVCEAGTAVLLAAAREESCSTTFWSGDHRGGWRRRPGGPGLVLSAVLGSPWAVLLGWTESRSFRLPCRLLALRPVTRRGGGSLHRRTAALPSARCTWPVGAH